MSSTSKYLPVEERKESLMHKLAKEQLAKWLHTEKINTYSGEPDIVIEEYPIIPDFCGTRDWGIILQPWEGSSKVKQPEKLPGGWYRGPTFEDIRKNPPHMNGEPVYPVAICDVFVHSSGKRTEAMEIWEVRHTHSVSAAKRDAVLRCYSSDSYSVYPHRLDEFDPNFFEIDASVILGLDANIKPKEALRKLRLLANDLNPRTRLTEKQWRARFEKEDTEQAIRELEKRFRMSEEYTKYCEDETNREEAKKAELEQALKVINMKEFLDSVCSNYSEPRFYGLNRLYKDEESKEEEKQLRTKLRIRLDNILKQHEDNIIRGSSWAPDPSFKIVYDAWMKKNDVNRLIYKGPA